MTLSVLELRSSRVFHTSFQLDSAIFPVLMLELFFRILMSLHGLQKSLGDALNDLDRQYGIIRPMTPPSANNSSSYNLVGVPAFVDSCALSEPVRFDSVVAKNPYVDEIYEEPLSPLDLGVYHHFSDTFQATPDADVVLRLFEIHSPSFEAADFTSEESSTLSEDLEELSTENQNPSIPNVSEDLCFSTVTQLLKDKVEHVGKAAKTFLGRFFAPKIPQPQKYVSIILWDQDHSIDIPLTKENTLPKEFIDRVAITYGTVYLYSDASNSARLLPKDCKGNVLAPEEGWDMFLLYA
ncbi:hypothetical protein L596_022631 [Steinernema carpocapsae]|uniref:Uncharacterized protein n=1 Tax=Steinernema carpocapsae TaxID=34508 RepID=A0A4U5MMA6_STECR|nr:hypothetical protein L596_022631 [Steinernema carpocapsae]